jgi:hypothetical protein
MESLSSRLSSSINIWVALGAMRNIASAGPSWRTVRHHAAAEKRESEDD